MSQDTKSKKYLCQSCSKPTDYPSDPTHPIIVQMKQEKMLILCEKCYIKLTFDKCSKCGKNEVLKDLKYTNAMTYFCKQCWNKIIQEKPILKSYYGEFSDGSDKETN